MSGHHLIFGTLKDIITGETLPDTDDERLRQNLYRLLLTEKHYDRDDLRPRIRVPVGTGEKKAIVSVDLCVESEKGIGMLVKYGPGSIVTRHRPALALSRLVAPYQIPRVVVTNGLDADVLDGITGRILSSSLDSLPDKSDFNTMMEHFSFPLISPDSIERESRIVYAFEVDDACPCDDTVCRI